MCEIIVRKASLEDVCDIVFIEESCFAVPRSEQTVAMSVENEGCFSYVAEKDGKKAGYIAASLVIDELCIERVAVLESARRCGIGGKLLDAALKEGIERGAEFIYLEVREKNANAISLYTAAGFETIGMRKNYYGAGEHALVMVKKDKILPK